MDFLVNGNPQLKDKTIKRNHCSLILKHFFFSEQFKKDELPIWISVKLI